MFRLVADKSAPRERRSVPSWTSHRHRTCLGLLSVLVLLPGLAHAKLGTNLGPLGHATAQSVYGPGYEVEKGNDGNMGTRWSGAERQQWYEIQWTTPQTFNTVIIRNLDAEWNKNIPFTLKVWNDSTGQFTTVGTLTPYTSEAKFTFPDMTSTRIRVENVITFWELQVHWDDGTPEPRPPDLSTTSAVMLEQPGDYRLSLDGVWRFRFGNDAVAGFETPGFDDSSWETLGVPSNWEISRPTKPNQPGYDQQTGLYRRWIDVPVSWQGRNVFLYFRGVNNSAEVWVNGSRIDYHESGYTSFQMDITSAVQFGQPNLVAVRVCKQSATSDLDIGGYWHLGGIYRSVAMVAVPAERVENYAMRTHVPLEGACEVSISTDEILANPTATGYTVAATLIDRDGATVAIASAPVADAKAEIAFSVPDARLWSAEDPYLYDLLLALRDPAGAVIHQLTDRVGLREVTIRNAVLMVNNRPIWIHGFDRHETWATVGRALTTEMWRTDLELMKRCNTNTVRTSHYNPDPEFIQLCDEYGMYVIDEIPFCWASGKGLDDPSREEAFLQRARETLARDVNRPSVIIWSLGNENSGYGINMQKVIDLVSETDPTRPKLSPALTVEVFNHAYNGLDIDSVHYPTLDNVRSLATSQDRAKYPLVMTECTGVFSWVPDGLNWDPNQRDYWGEGEENYLQVVHQYGPSIAGGCIWAWTNESIENRWDPGGGELHCDGNYGGWGPWGIVDSWRNLKPEYWNMKKVYSQIRVQDLSVDVEQGQSPRLAVRSFYSFTNLDRVRIDWEVSNASGVVASGSTHCPLEPLTQGEITIPWTASGVGDYTLHVWFTDWTGRQVDEERIRLCVVSGLSLKVEALPRVSSSGLVEVNLAAGSSVPRAASLVLSATLRQDQGGGAPIWSDAVPLDLGGGAAEARITRSFDPGSVSGEIEVEAVLTSGSAEQRAAILCYRVTSAPAAAYVARNTSTRAGIAQFDIPNPGGDWRLADLASGEKRELTAIDGRLRGAVSVPALTERVFALEPSAPMGLYRLNIAKQGTNMVVGADGWQAVFDLATGRLTSVSQGGPALVRGPEIYLGEETPGINGLGTEWTLIHGLPAMRGILVPRWGTDPRISVGPDCVAIGTSAAYDLQTSQGTSQIATAEWTYLVYSQGVIKTTAEVRYSGPQQHAWELGMRMGLDKGFSSYSWERDALWSVYPEDHIGRAKGTVAADSYVARGTRIDAYEAWLARPDGAALGFFPLDDTFHVRCRPLATETEVFASEEVSPLGDVGAMLMPERIIVMSPGFTRTLGFNLSLRSSAATAEMGVLSPSAATEVATQVDLEWTPPVVNGAIGALLCVGEEHVVAQVVDSPIQPVNLYRNTQALFQIASACAGPNRWLVLTGASVSAQPGYDPAEFFGSPGFASFIEGFLAEGGSVVLLDEPSARAAVDNLRNWLPPLAAHEHPVNFSLKAYEPYDPALISMPGAGETKWPGGPVTWYGYTMKFVLGSSPRLRGSLTLETIDYDHGSRIEDIFVGGTLIQRLQNFDTEPVRVTMTFDGSGTAEQSATVALVQGNNAVITSLDFAGGYVATWPDFRDSEIRRLYGYFAAGRMIRCRADELLQLVAGLTLKAGPELYYAETPFSLASGVDYWIHASGTWNYNGGAGSQADAEWWTDNGWSTGAEVWTANGAEGANILDLHLIDGSAPSVPIAVDWEGRTVGGSYALHTYSPTHEYRLLHTGTGYPIRLFLSDIVPYGLAYYADNSGELSIAVAPAQPGAPQVPDPPAVVGTKPPGWYATTRLTFVALQGFGSNRCHHYQYAWDTSPTRATWNGAEPSWTSGDLSVQVISLSPMYLHVRAVASDGTPGGSINIGPYSYDGTPPSKASAVDDGYYTDDPTMLHCAFSASDLESGISGYSYAIGVTSSDTGYYVVPWADTASSQATVTGLQLSPGVAYYFYARARNGAGTLGQVGSSNGIRYVQFTGVPTPRAAASLGDGAFTAITTPVAVYAVWPGVLGVELADRSSGIAVKPLSGSFAPGDVVRVRGMMTTEHGERVLTNAEVVAVTHGEPPEPVGVPSTLPVNGLSVDGLFVRTTGRVCEVDSHTPVNWFDITDSTGASLRVGLRTAVTPPPVGAFVIVEGGAGMWSATRPAIWLRGSPELVME